MNVYGYPTYQCSQSDDLAKQMYAQQALASSIPFQREIPEGHVMPAPSGAPWNMHGLTWGMQSPPHLVQFTGQTPSMEPQSPPVLHCKRKSFDVEPVVPAKQLITEEKMAAHLSGLHISSEYTPHRLASEEFMDINMNDIPSTSTSSTNICQKLKDNYTVVLSEEVKKIKDEPLLPPALIERLEKPHMSLVVWKPKEDILDKIKEDKDEKENVKSQENPKKRNGVLVTELSRMDVEM